MTTSPLSSTPGSLSPLRISIDGLLDTIRAQDDVSRFERRVAEGLFRRSDDGYLAGRDLVSVLNQWRDLARWISVRAEGEVKVRVFHPTDESHGYAVERPVLQTCMQDQPFIFDSLRLLLRERSLPVHRVIHPIFQIERTDDGGVKSLESRPEGEQRLESVMHWELPRPLTVDEMEDLQAAVQARLNAITRVVADHQAMRNRALWHGSHLSEFTPSTSMEHYRHVAVAQKFMHWLADDKFVFIGYAEFDLGPDGATPRPDSALGLYDGAGLPVEVPSDAAEWVAGDGVIFLGKGEHEARIHRPGKTDHVALRLVGEDSAERVALFTGLYTQKAIHEEIPRIPILREKLEAVLAQQEALPGSHLARKLEEAFRAVPVEFLFTSDLVAIQGALRLIIAAEEGRETGVHLMLGPAQRTAFVLVSLPRERYDEEIRIAVGRRLLDVTGGNYMDWRVAIGQSENVVLQFYVTARTRFIETDEATVAAAIADVTGSWTEQLEGILGTGVTEAVAEELVHRYGEAFPEEYHQATIPAEAAEDVEYLEGLRTEGQLRVALAEDADDFVGGVKRLKLYQAEKILLTDSAPVIAHFGLRIIDQVSFTVSTGDARTVFVDSFRVIPEDRGVDLGACADKLVEGLQSVLRGEAPDDSLNGLIVTGGLSLDGVGVLRAYVAYARQLGATDPVPQVHRTWRAHPIAARMTARLFRSRFKPGLGAPDAADRRRLVARNRRSLVDYIDKVERVADDRILRRTLNLVDASLRTNFFSRACEAGHPLSIKIDCSLVEEMPSPRPYREIFVHHLKVDGVHLRGGPVARGGLRWSDRHADFRTEILGLMDTQMVKNVLIVPVGAKGGFVLKGGYKDRGAARQAADAYYKVFIRGLLDLTDNVVGGEVMPPANVVRYDGDDPYLVVAADKGTAHLSDTANGIAAEYGFWLDDAFASGGSHGYDHKAYAITAKGAWVCVRRHFREFGLDPEKDEITAAGIGDMSGDVFGNGMLLSKTLKLRAAFNHMHIFLDPTPKPGPSWKERKRLFDLPRSTWADYDAGLLSEGGGIFPRHAKSIALSPQVQAMLHTEAHQLTGDALVKAILTMEVDLLWNGGIGTYVKASHETHRQVGDSSNDAVRIDATQLHAKIVGEGGNLGFTQAARVEYASHGGRVNSDAVDNSGGVDMSDHEVNLKILFADVMRRGELEQDERDEILLAIAKKVSASVQANNHDHSLMLSLDVARSKDMIDDFRVLLNDLEAEGRLDRSRHVLPEDGEMLRRQRNGEGLLRPELTRVGPYVKMKVYEDLLASDGFEVELLPSWLYDYFPKKVRKRFGDAIGRHQLRREIAATVITNRLIDGMGVTHFSRMSRVTGASTLEIAFASLIAADLLKAWDLKSKLRDIPDVRASVEYVKLRHVEQAVSALAQWLLLRRIDVLEPQTVVDRFAEGFQAYEKALSKILDRSEKRLMQKSLRYLRNRNIRVPGSERGASLEFVVDATEAILLTEWTVGLDPVQAGMLLKRVAVDSRLLRARQLATPADARDGWESRAIAELQANASQLTLILARKALAATDLPEVSEGARKNRRGLRKDLETAWHNYVEANDDVFERAASLADRVDGARARGLAPGMVVYGAVRVLKSEN